MDSYNDPKTGMLVFPEKPVDKIAKGFDDLTRVVLILMDAMRVNSIEVPAEAQAIMRRVVTDSGRR